MSDTKKQLNNNGKNQAKSPQTGKKRTASDGISTKGCLTLILVISGLAALAFFIAPHLPAITIPSLNLFAGDSSGGSDRGSREPGGGDSDKDGGRDGDRNDERGADIGSDGPLEAVLDEYDKLMTRHDDLLAAVERFNNGELNLADFRDICADADKFFGESVGKLNRINAGEFQTHKHMLVAAAMSNQIAAAAISRRADGDIAYELNNPASDYNRNTGDADQAYKAFNDLLDSPADT